ncbi:translesion DNA synthesis-associated protein ImuA [Methyloversatilis discipulorum]|uniref:translesion DNA synthesis-associated protein ImuA n=1 Tax=Methyloversatilis discipulorum TaxID=1119528 RepID=UPI001A57732C|nr:translesion DNA synthesis-associated protein ImuA [Methyloversatilis discipulorum]MBL8469028.1 translesion DNA synthesis-associated protein ImuA [Methyloversatilis discipulorum]
MNAASLHALLRRPDLWRANDTVVDACPTVSTGHPALDAELPGGGWPVGDMSEVLTDCCGHGEVSLLLPMLAQASQADGWMVWVAPPWYPNVSALAAAGLRTHRMLVIQAGSTGERVWAMRHALDSGACSAVIGWFDRVDTALLRRLQLAVREAALPLVLFRSAADAHIASPAALRLQLSVAAEGAVRLDILKRRGRPTDRPVYLGTRPDFPPRCVDAERRRPALALVG